MNMEYKSFLIKYAEIGLKGKNRSYFEDCLVNQIRQNLSLLGDYKVTKEQGRVYVDCPDGYDYDDTVSCLSKIFGIVGFMPVVEIESTDWQDICDMTVRFVEESFPEKNFTFKMFCKRGDKSYPKTSPEIAADLGGVILDHFPGLSVDVRNPQKNITVEVRSHAYIYADGYKGVGGMPVGCNGKAMLLLSGGIDSPVAGYMIAKRGVSIDATYFHAPPYTSERAKQKVKEMINNVVDFGDSVAKDVMVPRIDVDFVSTEMSYDDVVEAFRANNYSRLPVYETTQDNVIGILFLKDLFHYDGQRDAFDVKNLMRKPFYTYEFKKTADLLAEMRRDSYTIAVVLDEYGATAGIITLEDLLEEIVGEIRDEYDEDEQDPITKISDTEFLLDGSAKLDDVNDATGLSLESDDYDSIAGHLNMLLEHIPVNGETVTDENGVTYEVVEVDKNRIDRVRITLPNKSDEAADTERSMPADADE